MLAFLFIYLLLYGGINCYMFRKIHAAWGGPPWTLWAAGGFMTLMILAPILMRLLERQGTIWPARILAVLGFTWMAVTLWFLTIGLAGDLWNLGVRIAGKHRPAIAQLIIEPRQLVITSAVIIFAASIWGVVEASRIQLEEVRIRTPELAPADGPVRIVQITDVHLSLILGRSTLQEIADLATSARPDIFVSTGDLADGDFVGMDHLGEILDNIPARWGKLACLGNHERYAGLQRSLEFHRVAGFQVLRGEAVRAGPVIVAGVDDPAVLSRDSARRKQEKDALDAAQVLGAGPVVLLKHRPQLFEESLGRFDVQLSGHTHGGQIFPFGLVVYAFNKVWPGLHELRKGSALYLSRGTGTWGPPFRLLAPPEVTLIILEPA